MEFGPRPPHQVFIKFRLEAVKAGGVEFIHENHMKAIGKPMNTNETPMKQ
jgi:hypothetical protein